MGNHIFKSIVDFSSIKQKKFRRIAAYRPLGLASLIATSVCGYTPPASAEWYVVVASLSTSRPDADIQADRLKKAYEAKCGREIWWDYSQRITGFTSGFIVVYSGPFESSNVARRTLMDVLFCVEDAYIKWGIAGGE